VAASSEDSLTSALLEIRSYNAADQTSQDSVLSGEIMVPRRSPNDQLITGLTTIAATPGVSAWSVVLRLDTLASGRVFNTSVPVIGQSVVVLSDLVLGVSGSEVEWRPATGPVALAPLGVFDRKRPVTLFFQVKSGLAAESARTSLALFRIGVDEERAALRLSFQGRILPGLNEVRRELDLGRLEPGNYRLEVLLDGIEGAPPAVRSTDLIVR
jgi:hypothetical protein